MEIEKLSLDALNRIAKEDYMYIKKLDYYVVADNLRSGQNVGSIFRSADAFATSNIYLTGISPTPPNKEVLKTALGATETVSWSQHIENNSLIEFFKDNNIKIIVVEQTTHSVLLHDFKPQKGEKYALILGNEVDGVSMDFIKNADLCVEIPQAGTKHSLNVSVCAGILMWHMYDALKST
jgi:23S rRNA (guanosine2251-2'-O)-methyltransferase